MFQIGEKITLPDPSPNRPGDTRVLGTYALHIQCPWRICGPEGIFVGSRDVIYPAGEFTKDECLDFDWTTTRKPNRCKERSDIFFSLHEISPLVILKADVDNTGGFKLTLTQSYSLEVIPFCSTDFTEHWRLFTPGNENPHWVFRGNKIYSE